MDLMHAFCSLLNCDEASRGRVRESASVRVCVQSCRRVAHGAAHQAHQSPPNKYMATHGSDSAISAGGNLRIGQAWTRLVEVEEWREYMHTRATRGLTGFSSWPGAGLDRKVAECELLHVLAARSNVRHSMKQ